MSYALDLDALSASVRRVAVEQLDAALRASQPDANPHEAVHELRKRAKRVRALVRLVRDACEDVYDSENRALRDAARTISDLRDAAALVETCDALAEHATPEQADGLVALRTLLTIRLDDAATQQDVTGRLRSAREPLAQVRQRAVRGDLSALDLEAVIEGARRTYRRGRKRVAEVRGARSVTQLHQLRKRAKYSRFHHRLLKPLWPDSLGAAHDAFELAADRLGDHHDLAVLLAALDDPKHGASTSAPVRLLIVQHLHRRFAQGFDEARRAFAEEPASFARRLLEYARVSQDPTPRVGHGAVEARIRL